MGDGELRLLPYRPVRSPSLILESRTERTSLSASEFDRLKAAAISGLAEQIALMDKMLPLLNAKAELMQVSQDLRTIIPKVIGVFRQLQGELGRAPSDPELIAGLREEGTLYDEVVGVLDRGIRALTGLSSIEAYQKTEAPYLVKSIERLVGDSRSAESSITGQITALMDKINETDQRILGPEIATILRTAKPRAMTTADATELREKLVDRKALIEALTWKPNDPQLHNILLGKVLPMDQRDGYDRGSTVILGGGYAFTRPDISDIRQDVDSNASDAVAEKFFIDAQLRATFDGKTFGAPWLAARLLADHNQTSEIQDTTLRLTPYFDFTNVGKGAPIYLAPEAGYKREIRPNFPSLDFPSRHVWSAGLEVGGFWDELSIMNRFNPYARVRFEGGEAVFNPNLADDFRPHGRIDLDAGASTEFHTDFGTFLPQLRFNYQRDSFRLLDSVDITGDVGSGGTSVGIGGDVAETQDPEDATASVPNATTSTSEMIARIYNRIGIHPELGFMFKDRYGVKLLGGYEHILEKGTRDTWYLGAEFTSPWVAARFKASPEYTHFMRTQAYQAEVELYPFEMANYSIPALNREGLSLDPFINLAYQGRLPEDQSQIHTGFVSIGVRFGIADKPIERTRREDVLMPASAPLSSDPIRDAAEDSEGGFIQPRVLDPDEPAAVEPEANADPLNPTANDATSELEGA